MTSRPKSVKTKPRRSAWESERRLQVVVTSASSPSSPRRAHPRRRRRRRRTTTTHLMSVADGQAATTISKDQLQRPGRRPHLPLSTGEGRLREAVAAGELEKDVAQQQLSQLEQSRATASGRGPPGPHRRDAPGAGRGALGHRRRPADIEPGSRRMRRRTGTAARDSHDLPTAVDVVDGPAQRYPGPPRRHKAQKALATSRPARIR